MKMNFGVIEMFNRNSKVIAQLLLLSITITLTCLLTQFILTCLLTNDKFSRCTQIGVIHKVAFKKS